MDKIRTIGTLTIESTLLCHNFINTVYAWRGENLNEYLKTYQDVIDWCAKVDLMDKGQLSGLSKEATCYPEKAKKALLRIKKVRATLYQLVSAIASAEEERYAILLKQVNPLIAQAMNKFQIVYENKVFVLSLIQNLEDLESPLWLVLRSMQEMLLNVDLKRIKECPTCGWVFLDETKNGVRKWCSPIECGTKDKMLRYQQKKRAAQS